MSLMTSDSCEEWIDAVREKYKAAIVKRDLRIARLESQRDALLEAGKAFVSAWETCVIVLWSEADVTLFRDAIAKAQKDSPFSKEVCNDGDGADPETAIIADLLSVLRRIVWNGWLDDAPSSVKDEAERVIARVEGTVHA